MGKPSAAAAWSAAVVAVAILAALVPASARASDVEGIAALWPLAWVGFSVVGAVIASRRPQHPVGWLLLGIGFCVAMGAGLGVYAIQGFVYDPGSLPAPIQAAWVGQLVFIVGIALIPYLLLLFPSGTFPSKRWRTIAGGAAVVFGLLFLSYAVREIVEVGEGGPVANPFAVPALGPATETLIPPLSGAALVFALAVLVQAVLRFRRSRGAERQQLKWFVFAAGIFPPLMLTGVVLDEVNRPLSDMFVIAAFLGSLNGMAVGIGFAIFRYRLYEIDRVISRTIAYAVVVGVLAGVYLSLVLTLQRFTRPLAGGTDLAVATSTLAVAALFRPLNRRVRDLVNRRFNRSRYDAALTIENFAVRLRDEIDLDALGAELQTVVTETMQPASVFLWTPVRGDTTE